MATRSFALPICLLLLSGGQTQAADVSHLKLATPVEAAGESRLDVAARLAGRIDRSLPTRGPVEVWVQLVAAPLAEVDGPDFKVLGHGLGKAERQGYLASLAREQDAVSALAASLGGTELGRVSRAHDAIAVRIDAGRLASLAADSRVLRITPVVHYELALSETVPYIGAAAAQAAGDDGTGARVAVLDSGADYTHWNLGGPGTTEAYEEAVSTFPNPYFPSSKVVGGYDYVGNLWPNGARMEDPNPIDDGPGGGHGTHVADIVAGRSADGTHVGVAPGAQLYAVKVCSSVSTSCNGIALLKAVDFALDPDQDGTMNAVDVISLSLGSNYGMNEDDLTQALEQASKAGVVVVAAAGNAANRPYIVSSPSAGERVISVAQTQVPSAAAIPLVVNAPESIAGVYGNVETVPWAPVDHTVTGDVVFVGRGCPAAGTTPEDPYLADPAGKIALIDRGVCAISLKVDRAVSAGAVGVLIGLVAAGDAISFSYGGGTNFAPTLVITQDLSLKLKAAVGPNATISPDNAIPLVGSMVSSSARGPSISYQAVKPEIGAPGASVSAVYGTGTGEAGFGGTSGATPMISGSAAILRAARPWLRPDEVKALLMNTADPLIFEAPALRPGKLAPVSRIGAGEVRVDRALAATAAAWVPGDHSAALSFGYVVADGPAERSKEVRVDNWTPAARTFSISSSFRFPDKAANAAVVVHAPASVSVSGGGSERLFVTIDIDPSKLPDWLPDGGPNGGNGLLLDGFEVDGYLTLTDETETLTLPWHVLPKKAASIRAPAMARPGRSIPVHNDGAADGVVETFSLTGTSDLAPASVWPRPGDNFAMIDLAAVGVRVPEPGVIQFGIHTYGYRAHPNYPAEFDVFIDTNEDGAFEWTVFNAELGGFGASGQNVVYFVNNATGRGAAYYYTDAELDSSNVILTAPLWAMGLSADTRLGITVAALDNYYTGYVTDAVEGMTYTPSKPVFTADVPVVPAGGQVKVPVTATPENASASPSQTGLLFLYRTSDPRNEAQTVAVH